MESMMIWRAALEAARGMLGRLVMSWGRWGYHLKNGLELHRVRCIDCELTTDWYPTTEHAEVAAGSRGWQTREGRWRCNWCLGEAREARSRAAAGQVPS